VVGEAGAVVVDAEVSVEGRQKIFGAGAAFDHFFAAGVGRTDDASGADAAAGEKHRVGLRPVVATGLHRARGSAGDPFAAAGDVRDAGGAAEFAGDDDEDALVEASGVDVFNEGGDRLVDRGHAELQGFEDVLVDGVVVPVLHASAERAVEFGGDDFNPGLDEPAGHETLLAPLVAAIAVADGVGFAGEVEGGLGLLVEQESDGLRFEAVEGVHRAGLVDVATQAVEGRPHIDPGTEAGLFGRVFETDVGDFEGGKAGVAEDAEGFGGGAEVGRTGDAEAVVLVDGVDGHIARERADSVGTEAVGNAHPVGVAGLGFVGGIGVAGEDLQRTGGVAAAGVSDGAEQRVLVGDGGEAGEQFGDDDAGDVGVDGAEGAAIVGGGERFGVEGVEMAAPTAQPDEDDGGALVGKSGLCEGFAEAEEVREGEAGEAVEAEAEGFAAGGVSGNGHGKRFGGGWAGVASTWGEYSNQYRLIVVAEEVGWGGFPGGFLMVAVGEAVEGIE
jgi:hypothetical protein